MPSQITNAGLAQKINDLIAHWQSVQNEFQAWINGTVGGGALSDGRYPLTDYLGSTRQTLCPAQLEDDVSSLVTGAQGYASTAQTAATNAAASAALATTEANRADSAKDSATASAAAASGSASSAASSASTAISQASVATTAATNASASAAAALVSETNAAASAAAAAASAAAAATFDPALYAALADNETITGVWSFNGLIKTYAGHESRYDATSVGADLATFINTKAGGEKLSIRATTAGGVTIVPNDDYTKELYYQTASSRWQVEGVLNASTDLTVFGNPVAVCADAETITGKWEFSGSSIGASYGTDGRYTDLSGTGAFGATIWTLDSTWLGTGVGNTYNPVNVYGLAWLRASNSVVNSNAGEGLYVYQNGAEMAALGQYAAVFKAVLPQTSATYNLGASTARWNDAFMHGLWVYDSTAADSINMFHNGTDLRVNCVGTRWWAVRGPDVLQLDADSAGSSPIPSLTAAVLNHAISVTSTTDGDCLGFLMYNVDGVNNPRAGFFMDDTNATWGHSLTWSSGAPMDYGIWLGGTKYFGVDYAYNDTGRTSTASALDHSNNLRQLGFNDMKRVQSNSSFTLAAQHVGASIYYNTGPFTITTEANSTLDFPIDGTTFVINRSSSAITVAAGAGVTVHRILGGSSPTGSATIGAHSVATIWRYDASNFMVWGNGVT